MQLYVSQVDLILQGVSYLMSSRGPWHKLPGRPHLFLQPVTPFLACLDLPLQGCQVLPPLQGFFQLSAPLELSHLSRVL